MGIVIEVDRREREGEILEALRAKEDIVVEERHLSIGDYRINNHQKYISL